MTVRRTQAERRAETERRVLDATMAIIAAHGVRAVTMAAVGEAAGYSRGIVNHQFGTRQALMAAVAETVQARFAPTASGLTGRERVVAMAGAYLVSLPPGRRTRASSAPVDRGDRRRGAGAATGVRAARRGLSRGRRRALGEGLRDGTVRADVEPRPWRSRSSASCAGSRSSSSSPGCVRARGGPRRGRRLDRPGVGALGGS